MPQHLHHNTLAATMLIIGLSALVPGPAAAGEWSGDTGLELRAFLADALDPRQEGDSASIYLQAEYFHDWDDGDQRFVFAPFLRLDQSDAERSHFDLREFYWRRSFAAAELAIGLKKVYWGVTESAHLVDIINQTDGVENIDTEDKLGQPMLNLTLLRDWGTVDLFVMPFFRERTFAGPKGRLRLPFELNQDNARYESSAGEHHLDVAVRWAHYFGDWDVGLAHFSGTGREPTFDFAVTPEGLVATPVYSQIEQSSIDLQLTKGSWLWKLEAINRNGQGPGFQALAAGFEFT
ncbi:MAG: hypothetical protein HKM98_07560, partial [Gammaproteobacteria bacterium]|nr:hypothetical protein [Gammaproteobacteria bacterium]